MITVIKDRTNEGYMQDNRLLGNCYTVSDGKNTCHYEFEINGHQALVKYDSILLIKNAIEEFRKYNLQVSSFKTENGAFYQGFEETFTFKLPLSILQPSKFFLDQEKLDNIEKYLSNEEFYIPVCIIDDEYVILDGHARIKYLLDNNVKMVNVFLAEKDELTEEYVYIAKENNIFKVKNMEILSHQEYLEYLRQTGREQD